MPSDKKSNNQQSGRKFTSGRTRKSENKGSQNEGVFHEIGRKIKSEQENTDG